MRNKVIIGNWKMNKNSKETIDFMNTFKKEIKKSNVLFGVAPSFTNLIVARQNAHGSMIIAAQDCWYEQKGAFTGAISFQQLKDEGITHVIVGHSERRVIFQETDQSINLKVKKLLANDMVPILCIGETLQQRESGVTNKVCKDQLKINLEGISADDASNLIIAYEPIWAIGTGKTATADQAQETISYIRVILNEMYGTSVSQKVIIQYGGSVTAVNVKEILSKPDIDGALVGGASLDASAFVTLIHNAS
jgi:triosephosphate isomerase